MGLIKYLSIFGLGTLLGATGTGLYHDYPMYKQGVELQKKAKAYKAHWYNYLNLPKGIILSIDGKALERRIIEDSFFLKYFLDK